MKTFIVGVVLLIGSVPLIADVVTNTSCVLDEGSTMSMQTNPSACSVSVYAAGTQIPLFTTSASISSSQSVPVVGSSSSSVGSSFVVNAQGAGNNIPDYSDANAFGDLTALFATSGPVRSGYIVFTEQTGIAGISSELTSNILVGSLSQQCSQGAPGNPTCSGAFGEGSGLMPFTLGTSFLFSDMISVDVSGGGSIPHYATGGVSFTFSLLEADGVTPVQIYAVPEPATFLPASAFALLLFAGFSRRQSHR